jgi:glucose-1-phosphate cytidylyltransferase
MGIAVSSIGRVGKHMKVVLFCGGYGMRLREYSENIPKPMVTIGYRPIIWHLMKYYAYYGHKDFILCLGYKGDAFKKYFLEYDECISNDFTLSEGGSKLELGNSDIHDWRITFVDTGMNSNIGQRLVKVKKYLMHEEVFFANYSDGLTDMNLEMQYKHFVSMNRIASFMSVKPNLSYHTVSMKNEDLVDDMKPFKAANIRINGGFFILKNEIFDYIKDGEELVQEPFHRLIRKRQLITYEYNGFWGALDTFKDKQVLDELYEQGNPPWQVWSTENCYSYSKEMKRIKNK